MPRTGTGRIYQRGDTWWVDYSVRGKRYRESSGSTKKKAATDLLKKRLGEVGCGRFVGPAAEHVTLDDLANRLRDDYRLKGCRTVDRAELSISHLLDYFSAEALAVDITADRLTAYALQRREKGAADATIKRELMALSRMFTLALRENGGPLPMKPKIPTLALNNTRRGFLDGADLEAVIEELPEPLKPVVRFATYTGWRKSEILSLTWAQVDFDAGVIRLWAGTTKNREGRSFPFGELPELAALLEAQRDNTRATERRTGRIVTHVFHRDGEPIKSMRRVWNGACKRAGVPSSIFHDLRRTAVRNLVRAGVSEKTAISLVGHKTRSIFDRYNIVDDTDRREAMGKLSRFYAERSGESRTVVPLRRQAAQ